MAASYAMRPPSIFCELRPSRSLLGCRNLRTTRPCQWLHYTMQHHKRAFSVRSGSAQTFTASRILPYHASQLFNVIADISSYSSFIPYCASSTITSTSAPHAQYHKTWPRTADLKIAYGPYEETFKSKVYCLPYHTLEAIAGTAQPTIPPTDLPHYSQSHSNSNPDSSTNPDNDSSSPAEGAIFESLLTRWTFREFPFKPAPLDGSSPQEAQVSDGTNPSQPRTEVGLLIQARFANPLYTALSQAVAPKVAATVVEAFEKRARSLLGGHVQ